MDEPLPSSPKAEPWTRRAARAADLLIAATALFLLLPLILVVCAAILAESGRPVLFRQTRLGQHGRPFHILKFKKFRDARDGSGPHLTSLADRRMTRIGGFLQRSKLDEVPQFLNVLAGDMAIIGPRPESLPFADCFGERFGPVLSYKPGIFGPNQMLFRREDALLAGRAEVETYYRRVLFPLKAAVDLAYFSRRTLLSDLRLILGTAVAICGGPARAESLLLTAPASPDPSAPPGSGALLPTDIGASMKI